MYQEENAGKKKVQRLYLISFDACGAEDLEMMRSLPNFGRVMERAAICERVASVYPSLTYPAHTSVITGKMPKHHGVVNNTLLQPNRPTPDWMWQRKYIKGTTLYDEMLQRGWTVASLLWPVTAKSKITYNLPEVMANRPWQSQMTVSAMNGSLAYQLELNKKFGKLRDGIHQPALDHFTHASALHTIEKYHPNMMLIHYTDVDTNRHIYGVHHKKVTEAMKRHDVRLGELLQCIERTGRLDGTWQDTTIVLLGDHYQQDTTNIVYLNYLLREHGLLTTQDDRITSYRVIAKNCDGSCYLYLNAHSAIEREQIMTELETVLSLLKKDEKYGVSHIYTGKEAGELGADDTCAYMIEAKQGYYYLDEFDVLTRPVNEEKKHKMRATHGYLPTNPAYQTFFMAMGCGIREGIKIDAMNLWDEGTTLARLLGVSLGEVDGRIITELLSDS